MDNEPNPTLNSRENQSEAVLFPSRAAFVGEFAGEIMKRPEKKEIGSNLFVVTPYKGERGLGISLTAEVLQRELAGKENVKSLLLTFDPKGPETEEIENQENPTERILLSVTDIPAEGESHTGSMSIQRKILRWLRLNVGATRGEDRQLESFSHFVIEDVKVFTQKGNRLVLIVDGTDKLEWDGVGQLERFILAGLATLDYVDIVFMNSTGNDWEKSSPFSFPAFRFAKRLTLSQPSEDELISQGDMTESDLVLTRNMKVVTAYREAPQEGDILDKIRAVYERFNDGEALSDELLSVLVNCCVFDGVRIGQTKAVNPELANRINIALLNSLTKTHFFRFYDGEYHISQPLLSFTRALMRGREPEKWNSLVDKAVSYYNELLQSSGLNKQDREWLESQVNLLKSRKVKNE